MYLPLAGYKKKKAIGAEMSVDSIGSSTTARAVQPTAAAVKPQQELQEVFSPDSAPQVVTQEEGHEDHSASCSGGMSTQDFLALRGQPDDEPFAILDEVIAKIKDNMEEVGEALETMFEMAEQTSESKVALELLEKMFEAIDATREDK